MKKYSFIFKDKKNNTLLIMNSEFSNIKEARKYAKRKLAESNMNDLHKIVVKLHS